MTENLASTGIGPLDIFLKGGLPRGFTTVLLAPSGSGGEIFAKQFATNHPEERIVYVTTDESRAEVEATMRQAGWDMRGLDVVDMQSDFAEAMLEAQQSSLEEREADRGKGDRDRPRRRFDPRELVEDTSSRDLLRRRGGGAPGDAGPGDGAGRRDTDYLGQLIQPFARLRSPDRMVVHSLDFFLNLYPVERVVASLTALKAANAKAGGQLLLVVAKGAHGGTTERRLELLSDCLIELEMTRRGTKFERYFMVKKVKNRSTGVGVSTYEIDRDGFTLETLERIM